MKKTEVIPIGTSRFETAVLTKHLKNVKINFKPFKTLGVWFSYNARETISLNFQDKLGTMEKLMNIWTSQNLSLKGKILIIKTLILPQITYWLLVCYCPVHILQKVDNLLLKKINIKKNLLFEFL